MISVKMGKLVEIIWHDAVANSRWQSVEAAVESLGAGQLIRSYGVIIGQTKRGIVIAGSIDEDGNVTSSMFVPSACVDSVKVIR